MEKLGRYRLVREIGRGAMGIVYEGFDEVLERVVAVKTINAAVIDADERAATLERFGREAKTAARIAHPNIVTIFDYGVAGSTAYIVMELVEAVSLKQSLKDTGRLSLQDADRVIAQILEALAAAHRLGIVHRDIKPSNILVLASGAIKVADFGIARIDSSTLTQTGKTMGTPSYMSPEQLRGQPVDGRADLFSAAVVLYELLGGERAFPGDTTVAMYKVLHESPQPLSTFDPRISPHIDAVVGKALAKEPAGRFPTAEAFLQAWRRAIALTEGNPKRQPSIASAQPSGANDATATMRLTPKTSLTSPRRSRIPLVAGLVVLVAGVALASYIARERFAGSPVPRTVGAEPSLEGRTAMPAAPPAVPTIDVPKEVSAAEVQTVAAPRPAQSPPDQPAEVSRRTEQARAALARPADRASERAPGRPKMQVADVAGPDFAPRGEAQDYGQLSPSELLVLQKRAAEGRLPAMTRLGVAYREGLGVARDYGQAARWFRAAADGGFAPAMQNLATLYRDGKGVARSDAEAIVWYRKAAAKGSPQAMNALGFMTMKGRGVAADDAAAVEWFRLGARRGDKAAMFNLGFMLEHGRGVEKDIAAAENWYRRSAALGDDRARERMAGR